MRRGAAGPVIYVICAVAGAYQLLTLLASLWPRRRGVDGQFTPSVSVLKPVRGASANFREAIRSNAEQKYPDFEILFGIADIDDSARPDIERLAAQFPNIHLIDAATTAPN